MKNVAYEFINEKLVSKPTFGAYRLMVDDSAVLSSSAWTTARARVSTMSVHTRQTQRTLLVSAAL